MQGGETELAQALARNVLLRPDAAAAEPLAAYVRTAMAGLAAVDDSNLLAGTWAFVDMAMQATRQEKVL